MRLNFSSVAAAGITFQAGSAAVDSATIISVLVFQLTSSTILVVAVTAILRFRWLFPQLFVGFLAQRDGSSMGYYKIGAFGWAACIALLAGVLVLGADWGPLNIGIAVMGLWTAYAFVSGIVAVPYNDIVARSIPSDLRSRLLVTRFLGGGLLAPAIAAIADRVVAGMPFPQSYAVVIAMAAGLMFLSSGVFAGLGEPASPSAGTTKPTFFQYLRDGIAAFQTDRSFRLFVFVQRCGGTVLMATPFFVVQAYGGGFDLTRVAVLLGAQTAGALAFQRPVGLVGRPRGQGQPVSCGDLRAHLAAGGDPAAWPNRFRGRKPRLRGFRLGVLRPGRLGQWPDHRGDRLFDGDFAR